MSDKLRVILAEKPSMGTTIAAALGLKKKGKGFVEGVDPAGNHTVCTWAIGHLVEAVEPEKYDKNWEKWDWSVLPMVPERFRYEVIRKTHDQFDIIEAQLARASEVVIATDAGREGELIAGLIFDKARCKAPALRLWTKSLTDSAILEAYRGMKPWSAYQGLRNAAYGRSMADWLVGMSGSRALTLRARSFGRQDRGAWPVGRVMTPTLAILVDRELEIRNFLSKDFFVVEGTFTHPAGTYSGKWFSGEKDRFDTADEAAALLADLKGRPARITKFENRKVAKGPEQFYDLTALQREANRRFGYSSERTLEIAQALYDAKVLSYPRTGSRYLTHADAAKIPDWLRTLKKLEPYKDFVAEIKDTKLSGRFVNDAEVEDHTALMPTDQAPNLASLPEDQRKIYDLVARRFLAAFFPDRIEAKTLLVTEIQGAKGPESFKTTGTAVFDPGWSRVDAPAQSKAKKRGKKEDVEEEEDKPLVLTGAPVAAGDAVTVKGLGSEAKKTTPPRRMTEADLLAAMQSAGKDLDEEELREAMKECAGIGTPATRAAVIEKLLDKGSPRKPKTPLVERQKNHLVPTQKGIDLIQLVPFRDLRSAELTGRWETDLDRVAKGQIGLQTFMDRIVRYTEDMTQTLKNGAASGPNGDHSMPSGQSPAGSARFAPVKLEDPCPRCGAEVFHKAWEGRHYVACSTKGCYFGFDVDADGNPTIKCVHCGGRVKTNASGKTVCGDCNQWQDARPRAGADGEEGGIRQDNRSAPEPLGECPKCEKGKLALHNGSHGPFVSCSDRDGCGLSYDADEDGQPKGGHCAKCKGPIRVFPSGAKRCAICGEWVNDTPRAGNGGSGARKPVKGGGRGKPATQGSGDRPPRPGDAKCPTCGGAMKTIWTKRQKWAYLCETDNRWMDA